MRISDWSSDVCSSDLLGGWRSLIGERQARPENARLTKLLRGNSESIIQCSCRGSVDLVEEIACENAGGNALVAERVAPMDARVDDSKSLLRSGIGDVRSEEHTSELQSLMRISYAVYCLNKQTYHPPHMGCPLIT